MDGGAANSDRAAAGGCSPTLDRKCTGDWRHVMQYEILCTFFPEMSCTRCENKLEKLPGIRVRGNTKIDCK